MLPILPGVYALPLVQESEVVISTPNKVYMVGLRGTGGTGTNNVVTAVNSIADFEVKFGTSSLSLADVTLYFANTSDVLHFVAVELTVPNDEAQHLDFATSFDVLPETGSGILVCPAAYNIAAADIDYDALTVSLSQTQARTGLTVFIDIPAGLTVAAAVTFIQGVRPLDNMAVFYPALTVSSNAVMPSSAMAALTIKAIALGGIATSAAGSAHPIKGATLTDITNTQWESLFALGINVLRNRRGSVIAMGCRTLSANRAFINTSMIINSIRESLLENSDPLLFQASDNQGQVYNLGQGIASRVMMAFFEARALVGLTPRDAFQVICDSSNNTAADRAAGILNITVILQPASAVERVFITPRIAL